MHKALPPYLRITLLGLLLAIFSFASASAQTIYGTSGNQLVSFSATNPTSFLFTVPITDIANEQVISGLDFRPNTGQLYTIGYNNSTGEAQLYTINLTTGVATSVGAALALAPNMGLIGFDFNPTVDRIRVTGSNGSNYRIHPVTGAIAATDVNLAFAATDVNADSIPSIGAVAYTNSFPGTGTTTLYDFETNLNLLVSQNPPNNGTLNTIGSIGTGFILGAETADLDIYFDPNTGTNTAYLVRSDTTSQGTILYTVDLTTGAATTVDTIEDGTALVYYIAVQIPGVTTAPLTGQLVYALTTNNNLVTFDSENPEQIQSIVTVTGITVGQMLSGIDFRPATGGLYGLGYNMTTGEARIYTINTTTGAATAVGDSAINLGVGLGNIGFDFNPTVDRIRITGSNGGNFRLNPITGAIAATDSPLSFAAGDANQGNGSIGASAYTNSFNGATTTTLYNIAQGLGILTTQNPPNNGTLNTVGALGIQLDSTDRTFDLDIFYDQTTQTNVAYLAANTLGGTSDVFYQVNLTTGAATAVGNIGLGVPIKSIAVVLDSVPQPQDTSGVDLALTASVTPTNYSQYVDVTYTITVTNTGSETADSVTVAAGLPNGVVYTSSSVTQGNYNLFFERWDVGSLAPGQSATLTLVLFPLGTDSSVVNFFQVLSASGDDSDSTPGNDTDNTANEDDEELVSIIGPVQPPQGGQNADLSLFASVDSTGFDIYEDVTYRLVLVNNGPDAADSITVSARLPQGFVYTSSNTTGGTNNYNLFFQRWDVGYLAAGDTARLDLILFPLVDSASVSNFFEVLTSGQDDPDSTPGNGNGTTANEDDEAVITIFADGQPPLVGGDTSDLSLTITTDSTGYNIFEDFVYHLNLVNNGPDAADGVTVSAALPAGFAFTSSSAGNQYDPFSGLWNVGYLANGDSVQLDLTLFPLVDTADVVTYFQVMTSNQDDPDSTPGNGTNNTVSEDDEAVITIIAPPQPPQGGDSADLSLFATVDSTGYNIFENVTYQLTLVNSGPDDAAGITVNVALPEGFAFTGDTTLSGQYDPFTGIWNVGFLANGDTATLDLTVFALSDSSDVTAYFEILTSDQDDPDSTPGSGANAEDDQVTVTIMPNFTGSDPSEDRSNVFGKYSDVVLFPVPTADFITLKMNSLEAQESAVIYIFNQTGSLVRNQTTAVVKGENQWTFEVGQLPAGTYFVRLPGDRKLLPFIKL